MRGTYQMVTEDGSHFDVEIAPFALRLCRTHSNPSMTGSPVTTATMSAGITQPGNPSGSTTTKNPGGSPALARRASRPGNCEW